MLRIFHCKTNCDLPIAIALFVMRGFWLHHLHFAREISFFCLSRSALYHLSSFLPVSEMQIFPFFFCEQHLHRKKKGYPAFLTFRGGHTHMLSHAILCVFLAGSLLACILEFILRAARRPFRVSLREAASSSSWSTCNLTSKFVQFCFW